MGNYNSCKICGTEIKNMTKTSVYCGSCAYTHVKREEKKHRKEAIKKGRIVGEKDYKPAHLRKR